MVDVNTRSNTLTLALLLILPLFVGCGGAQPTTAQPTTLPKHHAWRLFPLLDGSAWAYDVDTGDGDNVLAVTRVIGVTGNLVDVVTGNDDVARYEQREDGIFRLATGAYLLKHPVEQGATWPSGGDKTATIIDVNMAIETLAGAFTECVAVEEVGAESGLTIRTVYCPDVGPVEIQSHMQLRDQVARVIARLRGVTLGGR